MKSKLIGDEISRSYPLIQNLIRGDSTHCSSDALALGSRQMLQAHCDRIPMSVESLDVSDNFDRRADVLDSLRGELLHREVLDEGVEAYPRVLPRVAVCGEGVVRARSVVPYVGSNSTI